MKEVHRTSLVLFAIALGVRVLYASLVSTHLDITPNLATPEFNYARVMASGFEWVETPHSPRAPGYPAALAAVYVLAFKQVWAVLFFQAVLGALTVLLVYRMGVGLAGRMPGLIAALWLALYVPHVHYASIFHRQILATLLLVVLMFILTRPLKRMRYSVFAGIVYTALIHVDPQHILLMPVYLLYIFFLKTRHRILNIQYLFLFVGSVIVLSIPWTIRNRVVYGQPVPIALEASRYFKPFKVFTSPRRTFTRAEERIVQASQSKRFQRNMAEYWRVAKFRADTEPADSVRRSWPPAQPPWSLRHNLYSILGFGLLLPFFVLGSILVVRDRQRTGILLLATTVVYTLARGYLGGGESARSPVEPLIILLAFYGAAALVGALERRATPGGGAS